MKKEYLRVAFWMIVSTCLIGAIMGLKKSIDYDNDNKINEPIQIIDTICPVDTIVPDDTIMIIDDVNKIEVFATMYHPVVGQCDDTPDITADQTKIPDIYDCSHLRWIAVSQDLLWFNGGPIRYGDTVYVYAGHKTGAYIVRDAMNKRFTNKIDFLESVGTDLYSFSDAKLLINS